MHKTFCHHRESIVCSSSLFPHSAGIIEKEEEEEEENAPGYRSGTAREGLWQGMAEVQFCDKHPIVVSVKWRVTLICLQDVVFPSAAAAEKWRQVCVNLIFF